MPYRIAGIDVHKKLLAVVISDVEVDGEYRFTRRRMGTSPSELRTLADWPGHESRRASQTSQNARSVSSSAGRGRS